MVIVSAEQGEPTVQSQIEARREENERGVRADPLVQAVLQKFPGAEIVAVRSRDGDAEPPPMRTFVRRAAGRIDDEPPFEDR